MPNRDPKKRWKLRNITMSEVFTMGLVLVAVVLLFSLPLLFVIATHNAEKDYQDLMTSIDIQKGRPQINCTVDRQQEVESTLEVVEITSSIPRAYYNVGVYEFDDYSTVIPSLPKEVYNGTYSNEPLIFTWQLNPCSRTWVSVDSNEGYCQVEFDPTAVCG